MNYKIRSGETLGQLATRFGTSVKALAKANGIKNVNMIIKGATLKVGGDRFEAPSRPGPAARPNAPGKPRSPGRTPSPAQTEGPGASSFVGGSIPITPTMKKLAEAGKRAAMSMGGYHSLSRCATGVSKALRSAMGLSVSGNGNQIDNNLPRSKFKQVNISLAEALKIPGLVLTWEKTSTAAGSKYGHTAITTGDGHSSASDFIERNTHGSGRSGLKIFVPI